MSQQFSLNLKRLTSFFLLPFHLSPLSQEFVQVPSLIPVSQCDNYLCNYLSPPWRQEDPSNSFFYSQHLTIRPTHRRCSENWPISLPQEYPQSEISPASPVTFFLRTFSEISLQNGYLYLCHFACPGKLKATVRASPKTGYPLDNWIGTLRSTHFNATDLIVLCSFKYFKSI